MGITYCIDRRSDGHSELSEKQLKTQMIKEYLKHGESQLRTLDDFDSVSEESHENSRVHHERKTKTSLNNPSASDLHETVKLESTVDTLLPSSKRKPHADPPCCFPVPRFNLQQPKLLPSLHTDQSEPMMPQLSVASDTGNSATDRSEEAAAYVFPRSLPRTLEDSPFLASSCFFRSNA